MLGYFQIYVAITLWVPFSLIGQFLASSDGYAELENEDELPVSSTATSPPKEIGPGVVLGITNLKRIT
jgi:hypothetical protein